MLKFIAKCSKCKQKTLHYKLSNEVTLFTDFLVPLSWLDHIEDGKRTAILQPRSRLKFTVKCRECGQTTLHLSLNIRVTKNGQ